MLSFHSAFGNWFLQTSGQPQYSLGTEGIHYIQPRGLGRAVVNGASRLFKSVFSFVARRNFMCRFRRCLPT